MSVTPASAKTSASPSFAQHTPPAPASICMRAMTGDLCVLACGRSALPAPATAVCMRAMLRASFDDSTRTAGVGISGRCVVIDGIVSVFFVALRGAVFDDQFDRVALVLVEEIVDGAGGACARPTRRRAFARLPHHRRERDDEQQEHHAPDGESRVHPDRLPDYPICRLPINPSVCPFVKPGKMPLVSVTPRWPRTTSANTLRKSVVTARSRPS